MAVTDLPPVEPGDVDSFELLARHHAPMIYRVAFGIVGNAEDAQDVAQRTLLSAWQGLGTFRGDAAVSTWLHQIARRHALNCVTRSRRTVSLDDIGEPVSPESGPEQYFAQARRAEDVHHAMDGLRTEQAQVVSLYHFQDNSYAEIASATGMSESAVRSHLFRGRRRLAAALLESR